VRTLAISRLLTVVLRLTWPWAIHLWKWFPRQKHLI